MATEPTVTVNAADLAQVLDEGLKSSADDAARRLRASLAAATPPPTLRDKLEDAIRSADYSIGTKDTLAAIYTRQVDAVLAVVLDHLTRPEFEDYLFSGWKTTEPLAANVPIMAAAVREWVNR